MAVTLFRVKKWGGGGGGVGGVAYSGAACIPDNMVWDYMYF